MAASASPFFISVVVVNYNGAPWLERCFTALTAQTYAAFEIVMVDNASTDESAALVRQGFPHVKIICSETNVGFAAGNNLGIRAARGDAIATLNSDTEAEKDYLEKLVAPLQDPRVGACAPLMIEMENPVLVDAAGIAVDRLGFAWNRGAGQPVTDFQRGSQVFGACAGAALYRRALLDQIGLFDESYFGFYEDADLAWRAHNAGWKTAFVPEARVAHQHGASFGKISQRKTYLLARNRWWTMFKNYPPRAFVLCLPLILLADAASLVRAAQRGHLREAWRGRADAWRTRNLYWQKSKNTLHR